jgi:lambda family phage portal protein
MRSIARDGEVIVNIVRGYKNKYNFAIRLIEPDQLDTHYNAKYGNNEIRMGVELNEWKVPIAYWIDSEHPGDYYVAMRSQGKMRVRVPANEILFPFRQLRAGQTRGMSWLASSMNYLKMLGGYEEAEIVHKRLSASKMGFFYTEGTDYGPTDPDNPDDPFTMEASPGLMDQLPPGYKFQSWDPQHSATDFEGFRKAMLRRVAAGFGVSYNTLAGDLESVNYSSLRDGKLTERETFKSLQKWFIDSYKRPLFQAWLEHSLDFGLIKANQGRGFALPSKKLEKFSSHVFIPRRWAWVDPKKDAEALEILRRNNWTTDADIISEQGKEIGDVYAQIDQDQQLAESFGIKTELEVEAMPAAAPSTEDDS